MTFSIDDAGTLCDIWDQFMRMMNSFNPATEKPPFAPKRNCARCSTMGIGEPKESLFTATRTP